MSTATLHTGTLPPGAVSQPYASNVAMPVVPDAISTAELQTYMGNKHRQIDADHLELIEAKHDLTEEMMRNSAGAVAANVAESTGSIAASLAAKSANIGGPVTQAGALIVSAGNGHRTAQRDLRELMNEHRDAIVQELGIDAEEVTTDHLRWLSERPNQGQLMTQIQEIDQRMGRNVAKSSAGLAGAAAGGAALPLIFGALFAPVTGGASLALTVGGSIAGGMVASNVANGAINDITGIDPEKTGAKELKRMRAKLEKNEPVNSIDVIKSLVAGDPSLQKEFDQVDFDGLTVTQQATFLEQKHPELLEASKQLAYMINVGVIRPSRLMTLPTAALEHPEFGGAQAAHDLVIHDIKYGRGTPVLAEQAMADVSVNPELMSQQASLERIYQQSPDEQIEVKPGGHLEAELQRRAAAGQNTIVPFNRANGGHLAAELERRAAGGMEQGQQFPS